MRRAHLLAGVLLVITSITAGCFYVPQGDEVEISIDGHENGTDIALSPISTSDSNFTLNGYLSTGGGAADRTVYRDISLRLYTDDEEILCVERVGDWNVSEPKNVTVSSPHVPKYVVLYSPDFWNEAMTVEYFTYDPEQQEFVPRDASAEDELPVDVSEDGATACRQ